MAENLPPPRVSTFQRGGEVDANVKHNTQPKLGIFKRITTTTEEVTCERSAGLGCVGIAPPWQYHEKEGVSSFRVEASLGPGDFWAHWISLRDAHTDKQHHHDKGGPRRCTSGAPPVLCAPIYFNITKEQRQKMFLLASRSPRRCSLF